MAGPGICVLCLADTCACEVHPVFNPITPYGYMLHSMYLFIADIHRKPRIVCVMLSDLHLSRHHPLLLGTAPVIQRVHMAGLSKNGNSGPYCWGGRFRHNVHSSLYSL